MPAKLQTVLVLFIVAFALYGIFHDPDAAGALVRSVYGAAVDAGTQIGRFFHAILS